MSTSRKSVAKPTEKTNPHPPRASGHVASKGRTTRAPGRPAQIRNRTR